MECIRLREIEATQDHQLDGPVERDTELGIEETDTHTGTQHSSALRSSDILTIKTTVVEKPEHLQPR